MKDKIRKSGLEDVIKSATIKVEVEQKKRQKEKAEHDKRVAEFWNTENKLDEEKKNLYSGILAWRNEFVLTPYFNKIFDVLEGRHRNFLIIFGGGWGHTIDGDGHGCWSRITLDHERKLEYQAGFKWMGLNTRIILEKEYEIVTKFTHQYLQKCHDYLHSDDVYERIKKEMESTVRFL